jgi:hypothetical protein
MSVLVVCAVVVLSGCSTARFVQVGQDGGVVAISNNSNRWPTYNRDRAMALIKEKCPNGYEIVAEEEVVTGQVAHTNSTTNTQEAPAVVLGGANSSNGSSRSSGSFGSIAIPVGTAQQDTVQTTSYSDVTEWRITYRAK